MQSKVAEKDIAPEQRERVRHGDIFMPASSYHSLIPDTYTELSLHWHEEMEITLIREGRSDYRVGRHSFRAEAGDLILVPPYTLHSAMELPGARMVSDSLVFHPDFLGAAGQDRPARELLRPLSAGRIAARVRVGEVEAGHAELTESFLGAWTCFAEKKPYYELHLKELLLHLLYLLFREGHLSEMQSDREDEEKRQEMQAVLRYIGEHYRERITIGELADLVGFSGSYFMSFFKQHAGMTCVQYINEYRIRRAAEELEGTSRPVMEIAMDHGFNNISYFNLQFRRRFGMTPGEFRGGGR